MCAAVSEVSLLSWSASAGGVDCKMDHSALSAGHGGQQQVEPRVNMERPSKNEEREWPERDCLLSCLCMEINAASETIPVYISIRHCCSSCSCRELQSESLTVVGVGHTQRMPC